MKKLIYSILNSLIIISIVSVNANANASRGKRYFMKKLRHSCKKDKIRNGAIFAKKHDRNTWEKLMSKGKIKKEWKHLCPHAKKKIKRMKKKDVKNLYDFVWKYASDGEEPACGS